MTRTVTAWVRSAPSGSNSRSCSTRSSFDCRRRHRPDFVQEDRSAIGKANFPRLVIAAR